MLKIPLEDAKRSLTMEFRMEAQLQIKAQFIHVYRFCCFILSVLCWEHCLDRQLRFMSLEIHNMWKVVEIVQDFKCWFRSCQYQNSCFVSLCKMEGNHIWLHSFTPN